MEDLKKIIKDLTESFGYEASELVKEFKNEDFINNLKEKVSSVQADVKNTYVDKFKTENIIPDVKEDSYVVELVLPFLEKGDFALDEIDSDLVFEVTKNLDKYKSYIKHWSISSFKAVLSLKDLTDVDYENVSAEHKNGVFTLIVPRITKTKVKRNIEVN